MLGSGSGPGEVEPPPLLPPPVGGDVVPPLLPPEVGGVLELEGRSCASAAATFTRPPDATSPDKLDNGVTVCNKVDRIAVTEVPGEADINSAAAPATLGVAIEVPEK